MITIETWFDEDDKFNVRLTEEKEVEDAQADAICYNCDHLGFDFDGCAACTRPQSRADYSVKDGCIVKCKYFKKKQAIRLLDDFYGDIYIAYGHHEAWAKEFNTLMLKEMSLIEETSELTQAISKYYRNIDFTKIDKCKKSITEEMAHVLVSLRGLALALGIRPEDIQAEIEKKQPAAYEKEEK